MKEWDALRLIHHGILPIFRYGQAVQTDFHDDPTHMMYSLEFYTIPKTDN